MKKLFSYTLIFVFMLVLFAPFVSAAPSELTEEEAKNLFNKAIGCIDWLSPYYSTPADFDHDDIDAIEKRALVATIDQSQLIESSKDFYGKENSISEYMLIKDERYDTVQELLDITKKYFNDELAVKVLAETSDDGSSEKIYSMVIDVDGKAAISTIIYENSVYLPGKVTGYDYNNGKPTLHVELLARPAGAYDPISEKDRIKIDTTVSFEYTERGWRVSNEGTFFKYYYCDVPYPNGVGPMAGGTVNTGDTGTMIYITLAVASLCGIAIVAKRRKANA
ncbi:MAG: LPXTG cell wall anchor domain-containing protein [Ruminococcaceae bacterium]|nr:LPXTG cell wall anchor domain-containing protein [Oscillospiraceae bacterium]